MFLTNEEKEEIALYLGYSNYVHLLSDWLNQDFNPRVYQKVQDILSEVGLTNQEYVRVRTDYQATKIKSIELNMGYRQGLKQEMAELVWTLASVIGLPKDRVLSNYFEDRSGTYSATQVR